MPILRPELSDLPLRMRGLSVDFRGYPVPWFVAMVNGQPEFRAADALKWRQAVRHKLCWVCGQQLGSYLAFIIGPMCAITRTTAEPPSHRQCAEWSIKNCPFLSRPQMRRRENNMPAETSSRGLAIERNPGVSVLWIAHNYSTFPDHNGKPLIHVGDPQEITWWFEGRPATRAEVEQSVDSGYPLLEQIAHIEPQSVAALKDLAARKAVIEKLYPPLTSAVSLE